jgi:plasmid stabilization system protein ParE
MAGSQTYDTPEDAAREIERLRAELARLRSAPHDAQPPRATERQGWWRPVVAGVLVALAALIAPLSVLATWSNGQIQDTDRYLATVAPLADDPAVQEAIAARMEQVIFSYLDVDAAVDEVVSALQERGLPDRAAMTLEGLSGPLSTGIRGFVEDRILAVVQSDAFEQAWVEANRTAHAELVAALNGDTDGAVVIERGEVSVQLATLINTVKQQLVDAGFGIADRIPEVDATFAIVKSDDLETAQNLLGWLDDLSTWLPVVGLALIGIAVAIARDRRRMVLASGLAVAASMLLLGAALNVIRPFYLDALPDSSSPEAAGVVYDQLVSFIRVALRGVLVVALTVAVVAWLSSTHGSGATARSALTRGVDGLRRGRSRAGMDTGRLGVALATYRAPIRETVVAVAALLYLAQDHPTGGTALVFVLVTAVVLLVLEVLAARPEPAPAVPSAHE